jgi:hypothetical protein
MLWFFHLQTARLGIMKVMLCSPKKAPTAGPQDQRGTAHWLKQEETFGPQDQAPRVSRQIARGQTARPVGGKLTLNLLAQTSSLVLPRDQASDVRPQSQLPLRE